jgi:hypothetical protein
MTLTDVHEIPVFVSFGVVVVTLSVAVAVSLLRPVVLDSPEASLGS